MREMERWRTKKSREISVSPFDSALFFGLEYFGEGDRSCHFKKGSGNSPEISSTRAPCFDRISLKCRRAREVHVRVHLARLTSVEFKRSERFRGFALSKRSVRVRRSVVGALLARNGTGVADAGGGGGDGGFGLTAYSNTVVKRGASVRRGTLIFGPGLGEVGHEEYLHLALKHQVLFH